MDDLFRLAMAADGEPIPDTGNNGKASFPEYPGEKPTKLEQITWLDTWKDDLIAGGYGALLRKETPFALAKLLPKSMHDVTSVTDEARKFTLELDNARISSENARNKIEYDSRMVELKNGLASKLKKSLRAKAPLLLKTIEDKC